MTIERMKRGDSELLAGLENSIFSDSWSGQSIIETWEQKQSIIFVVRENEEILGYLIAYQVLDEVEIVRLATVVSARRRGIATKLLQELCNTAGIHSILLEVREHNDVARNFYQQRGFQEVGMRKNFYQNPTEHAILMKMMCK